MSRLLNISVLLLLVLAGCRKAAEPSVRDSSADTNIPPDAQNADHVRSVGLDTERIENLLGQIRDGTYKNIHSILIVKSGKLVVEEYFPGQEEDGQHQV